MIQHISELNRVLVIANSLSSDKGIERNALIEGCKSKVIQSRMPDHEVTVDFSVQIGFMELKTRKKLSITPLGKSFLDFNPSRVYDITANQKRFLIRTLFLDGILQRSMRECMSCFAITKSNQFAWSRVDGTPFKEPLLIDHLEQLELLRQTKTGYIVRKEYAKTVAAFFYEPKGYTETELLAWLEEKKRLGNIAEQIVKDFEVKRLNELGYRVESTCVKSVGKLKTNAGYDIESFNGKSKGMEFDRFIEVKGSGSPTLRFVWSQNEIEVSKKLGDKYWIYYQGGINKKLGKSTMKPIMIQDPFNTLSANAQLTQTPNGFVVAGPLRGDLISSTK